MGSVPIMKALVGALIAVAALAAWLATPEPVCASSGCGLRPIKPLPPIGCRDLVAQCLCDASGQDCAWTWVCVR